MLYEFSHITLSEFPNSLPGGPVDGLNSLPFLRRRSFPLFRTGAFIIATLFGNFHS